MKLLLVDDEEYVIESIKRNLDLTETGVSGCTLRFPYSRRRTSWEWWILIL